MTMTDPAPFVLPSRYVLDLRALGVAAYDDGIETANRLLDEVMHRRSPNAHRYELLARQQHTALLAATVAAALEETATGPRNPATRVAEGVCEAYRATHCSVEEGTLNRALAGAIARVRDCVRAIADEEAEEARHEAEVEQSIADHERELYEREQQDAVEAYERRYEL